MFRVHFPAQTNRGASGSPEDTLEQGAPDCAEGVSRGGIAAHARAPRPWDCGETAAPETTRLFRLD